MSNKISAQEFSEALEDNEDMMAEGAAMAVTCEQFGISLEDGYELLIEDAEEVEAAEPVAKW